jgi:hypothetical protein
MAKKTVKKAVAKFDYKLKEGETNVRFFRGVSSELPNGQMAYDVGINAEKIVLSNLDAYMKVYTRIGPATGSDQDPHEGEIMETVFNLDSIPAYQIIR